MGIHANKKLFKVYTFLWIGVLVTGVPIMAFNQLQYTHITNREKSAKFDIACLVCEMIQICINSPLNWTILLTYHKFSTRLEQTVA